MVKVCIVGPTSAPWSSIAAEVEADLARLARRGVELSYRCTGAGPAAIHTAAHEVEAAPHVVRAVVIAAGDGFDAVIIDCTGDPGVAEARLAVPIPVVGAGEALRAAIDSAPQPVVVLSGEELSALQPAQLPGRVSEAATVALGGTGHSHLVPVLHLHRPELMVLDPLELALDACLLQLG